MITVGAASANGASAVSIVAAHGLGARLPVGRVVPQLARTATLAVLPASVDLRKWTVTPGNQGQVGVCVTWAIDYAMLGWYAKFDGRVGPAVRADVHVLADPPRFR